MPSSKQVKTPVIASHPSSTPEALYAIKFRQIKRRIRDSGLLCPLANEEGFVLVAAIMTLLVLIILGISSTTTTNIELQIAGNDKTNKQTFYAADGGTEVGVNLLEENVACPEGFAVQPLTIGTVEVVNRDFWLQETLAIPSNTMRDIRLPANDAVPHTNITISGNTALSHGSALQMIAGYEGLGKGTASGGAAIMYDINSQHLGNNNAESTVYLLWRHVVGLEGECKY
ncbi:MAG: pilus assembly PilX N-terminal domain-containing protein [Desulfobulbaceae bacterium]|nr:pilus assembly PilX N-terminal domain-containing protein [Desulfobulbaceae bacterium]